jgi:hypothetical protein
MIFLKLKNADFTFLKLGNNFKTWEQSFYQKDKKFGSVDLDSKSYFVAIAQMMRVILVFLDFKFNSPQLY